MADSAWYEIKLKDNFSAGIKNAEKNVDQLEKKIKNLGNESNNTGNILRGVFGGVTLANLAQRAASAIKDVAFEVINLGTEMEKTRITMKTLLGGNQEFANSMISEFQQFAKETPFSSKEVVEGAKRLAAYQFQVKEMIPTLKKLGDVSSGLGLNLNDLIWVYGTTKVAGKVNARDIRQFQDRGVPITEYLSKATGKSQKEILGGLKDIDFKDISKAFDLMTAKGAAFGNLMSEISKTTGGRWERLKDTIEIIMTNLGERMLPTLGRMVDSVTELVVKFDQMDFRSWTEPLAQIWTSIKGISSSLNEIFNLEGLAGAFFDKMGELVKDLLFMSNTFLALFDYAANMAKSALSGNATGPSLTSEELMRDWGKSPSDVAPTWEDVLRKQVNSAWDARNSNWKPLPVQVSNIIPPKNKVLTGTDDGSTDLGMEKIQSGTRNITLNIDKLVGEITFEQTLQGSEQSTIDIVKRVLLTAVNDVNLTSQR